MPSTRKEDALQEGAERELREILLEEGLISAAEESRALLVQKRDGVSLADALLQIEAVDRVVLLDRLGDLFDVPSVDLDTTFGDALILDVLPRELAYRLQAIPLFLVDRQITVALADPADIATLDALAFATGHSILPVVALGSDIRRHLPEYYGAEDADAALAESLELETPTNGAARDEVTLEESGDQPMVKLVNLILIRALQDGASDIHLEPAETKVTVRYRIDGRLQVKPYAIPLAAHAALVSRIKVLGGLDIAEKRLPQDGRLRARYAGRGVDLRVSTFPTARAEKIVLRILDKEKTDFRLERLGMSDEVERAWRGIVGAHQGVVLVTGPTGSGKSSTLFATLQHLRSPDVNIVTLEDPVEYEIEGVTQGQVHERAGFTFARGLRAILRQDPDIILVGEIRDGETAQIAVQAALTGHLVLASLHTNDAPSAATRLRDMGVPAYLLAAALVGVLGQRLVRRLCPDCAVEAEPDSEERDRLGAWLDELPFLEGRGCPRCLSTGYRGRIALHEVLRIAPELRGLLSDDGDARALAAAARAAGYRTLWADGVEKVRSRVTSLRELTRGVDVETRGDDGASV